MNIVIIGDGKVGSTLTSQLLKENHNIVLIDNNADALRHSIDTQDVMCVEGNGAAYPVQKEAGVDTADLLIACTSRDERNMLCCLLAKKLGAKKTIARVRTPEYFYQMGLVKEELGLSMTINPEFAAAQEISRVLIFPAAMQVELFARGRVELVGHKIMPQSPLIGLSLAEIYEKFKIKVLVCAVQRDKDIYIPGGDFVLCEGDRIHLTAPHSAMEKFFHIRGQESNKIKTVLIIGGGRVGYYLASQLENLGMRVKIIEKDYKKCLSLNERLPKTTVVHGDGTDQDTLLEEGIEEVDAICSLTDNDEENIVVSMFASGVNVPKVITKINRSTYAEMAERLGLDTIISPKDIAASSIVSYVRALDNSYGSSIETMYRLLDDKVEALEFIIKEETDYLNIPLRKLKIKSEVIVACIVRDRKIIIPDGNEVLMHGDSVIIVTTRQHISDLKEIFA